MQKIVAAVLFLVMAPLVQAQGTSVYLWEWRALLPISAFLELATFLIFFRAVSRHRAQDSGKQKPDPVDLGDHQRKRGPAACFVRQSCRVPVRFGAAGCGSRAWAVLPVSALCELAGLTVFAVNILGTFVLEPSHAQKQPVVVTWEKRQTAPYK